MRDSTVPIPQARALFGAAAATLGLTAAHHAYGGVLYATPWRLHGAFVAVAIGVGLFALFSTYRRHPEAPLGRAAGWALVLAVLLFPVLAIGAFEGLYNHLVKNILFLANAPRTVLLRMFPPPTYELPNDAGFEISGVAQVIPAAFATLASFRFLKALRGRSDTPRAGRIEEALERAAKGD